MLRCRLDFMKVGGSRLRKALDYSTQALDDGGVFFNASVGGRMAGSGTMLPHPSQPHMVLRDIRMRPEFRNMGLGKKMVGDLLRSVKGNKLEMDPREVSEELARVLRSQARKSKNYTLQQHPEAHFEKFDVSPGLENVQSPGRWWVPGRTDGPRFRGPFDMTLTGAGGVVPLQKGTIKKGP